MRETAKSIVQLVIGAGVILILIGVFLFACARTQCTIGEYTYANWNELLFAIAPKLSLLIILFVIFKLVSNVGIELFFKKIYLVQHTEREYFGTAKLVRFFLWVGFIVLCLGIVFRNVGALLTSLGLIGFGITFALQKPIMNFVGWMTILTSKTYSIGDRVKIGEVRGDVVDIQVMSTVMMSLLESSDLRSDKLVTVPNELVLTTAVENYTKNSNFVTDELRITITYESNYRGAMELLHNIATEQANQNIHLYKQRVSTRRIELEKRINRLTRRFLQKEDDEETQKEIKALERERKGLDELGGEVKEQFKPRVRLEMLDSSLALICQFYCPYNAMKKNRTEINLKFLDAIKKRDDIEVAYPHIEVIQHQPKIMASTKLSKWQEKQEEKK
ncbi:MAG: mechanosensitive ion channel domain-containing protein [Candidatus Woesearchaeota archaeon]